MLRDPGNAGGFPTNDVDAACRFHDNCYAKAGLSASNMTNPRNPPKQCSQQKECDEELCDDLESITPSGTVEAIAKNVVEAYFGCE